MLSGGIDSTAALWHVLNRHDHYRNIHVHHIHIQNIENRHEPEGMAVNAIYEYIRQNSSTLFTTSESSIAAPRFGREFMYDSEAIGFMSGYMTSRDSSIDKLVMGVTADDMNSTDPTSGQMRERNKSLHNAFHRDVEAHGDTIIDFPLIGMTKQQCYDSIPRDLAKLTWSCRRPNFANGMFVECGVCKTCALDLKKLNRT